MKSSFLPGCPPSDRRASGEWRTLPHVAWHLVEHRALAVNNFVVRERQDEVLREGIQHGEGQQIVLPASIHRIFFGVLEDVVHPPHVPLVRETEPAQMDRTADAGKRGRLLSGGDRARVSAVGQRVQPLEKIDRLEIFAATDRFGSHLALRTRVVEIQHRRDRHAQAIHVIFVEPEQGVRQEIPTSFRP